jgi:hypothetical protein
VGEGHPAKLHVTTALLLLALLAVGCKQKEAEPTGKAVAPYVEWCEAQGAARNACLVSAAGVSGDASACAKLKTGAPERTACLLAAAKTSGRVEVCRPLADRDLVLCAFSVAAESGRTSACELLEDVHWQGGATRGLCASVAQGDAAACAAEKTDAELSALCLRFVARRKKDATVCQALGKDTAAVQRCAAAVAVANGTPEACAAVFSRTDEAAQHRCEVQAAVTKGTLPPCFGDVAVCERSLWVARPCEGTSGSWADDCLIHQAVFSAGPLGCGAVVDKKRRALCGRLREAQEGFVRARDADAGTAPAPPR